MINDDFGPRTTLTADQSPVFEKTSPGTFMPTQFRNTLALTLSKNFATDAFSLSQSTARLTDPTVLISDFSFIATATYFTVTYSNLLTTPGSTLALAPVPLPAGLPLLVAGLGAFAVLRRRQKRG